MSIDKLRMIAAAGASPVYMTAQDGMDLANQGLIEVNSAETDPNNPAAYRVQLTDAGRQQLGQTHHESPHNLTAPAAPQGVMNPSYGQQSVQGDQSGWNSGVLASGAISPQSQPQGQQAPQTQPQAAQKPTFSVRADVPVPKVRRGNGGNLKPRESQYPFDQLEENQSFHVPVTAEDQEPWKRMASNVSAANARNVKEVEPREMITVKRRKLRKDADGNPVKDANGKKVYDESTEQVAKTEPTKKFIARQVGPDDPDGAGVRIYRVPVDFKG